MPYLLLFHDNSGYANAPQYYVTRTLPVLLNVKRVDGTDIRHWALNGSCTFELIKTKKIVFLEKINWMKEWLNYVYEWSCSLVVACMWPSGVISYKGHCSKFIITASQRI